MVTAPTLEEDDDDSVYSEPLVASPSREKATKHTILDADILQIIDEALDKEEAAYLRDNPQSETDSDGRISISSSEEIDTDPHETGVEVLDDSEAEQAEILTRLRDLPTPPRMPPLPEELRDTHDDTSSMSTKPYTGGTDSIVDTGLYEPGEAIVDTAGDEDWFDSDENKVEVESLDSSSDSSSSFTARVLPAMHRPVTTNVTDLTDRPASREGAGADRIPSEPAGVKKATPGGGGLSLLTRASQTFYKAFKKTAKKAPACSEPTSGMGASDGKENREDVAQMHRRIEQLLETQIASLNGAKTGFVDVRLLQPMTEKTLEAVERDAVSLLRDFGEVEQRAKELEARVERAEREAEAELEAKEQMLIAAKVRLAEAAAEVDGLQHELRSLERELARPERVEMRRRIEMRRKRERLREEAVTVGEAREAAERRLGERRQSLERERAGLQKIESRFKDIEGDWA